MAAPGKSKSKTGMEEMLGKLFNSPGLAGAAESMDRVQAAPVMAPQPVYQPPIAASIESEPFPSAQPAVIAPSPTPSIINESLSDRNTGTHTGTVVGTDIGTHTGIDTGIDTNIQTGTDTDMDTSTDTGIEAYPDKHRYQQTGTDTDMGASIATGMDTGTHAGIDIGTHIYSHAGIHSGIDTGMQTGIDTSEYLYTNIDPEIWYPFTANQGRVLLYLIEAGGKTNRNCIERDTGVPLSSVAKVLAMLEQHGYIKRAEHKHYEHRQRGFYYSVNAQACAEFYERVRGQRIGIDTGIHTGTHTGTVTGSRIGTHIGINTGIQARMHTSPQAPFSSSRKEEKLTTAETPDTTDLLKDPELAYWKEKGINTRQLNAWSDEFQMPIDQVIQSLKYCRYEMVVLNLEGEKQISNPMNWFYKIMQRSGLYPKPAGYKSLAEIRAEQMEQAARDLAEARQRQVVAEQELAFQKIMENPTGEEYQALLRQVSEFAKEMGGKALETAMREIFTGGGQNNA